MAMLTAALLTPRSRRARPGPARRMHRGRGVHANTGRGAHDQPRAFTPLIDARAAGELLGVPHTWLLAQARAGRIPHHRLGHYVRFNPEGFEGVAARDALDAARASEPTRWPIAQTSGHCARPRRIA